VIVEERADLAQAFVEAAWNAQERKHPYNPKSAGVTTLIGCLLKAYYQRTGQITDAPDTQSMLTLLLGTSGHGVFGKAGTEEDVPVYWTAPMYEMEITGYVDFMDGEIPCELKTTSMAPGKVSDTYVEQLAAYCWMLQVNEGRLYVIHNTGYKKVAKAYSFEFSDDELQAWGEELIARLRLLVAAVEGYEPADRDPLWNDNVRAILFDQHVAWQCKYCPAKGTLCPGGPGREHHWFEAEKLLKGEA